MTDHLRIERDDASAPFFDAARTGRLLVRRCGECDELHPPAQASCQAGHELAWVDVVGTGTLVTWTVDHGGSLGPELTSASGEGEVIGIVQLDEGLWLNAALPGADPAALLAGQQVEVEFLALGGGEPVPVFVPVG
jgi:uncharacterized OB-fold protein